MMRPGHHFLHYRTNSAAAMYAAADVPGAAIAAARMLFVSGISQGISARGLDAVFEAIDVAVRMGSRLPMIPTIGLGCGLRPARRQ